MINKKYEELGKKSSVIRELFEFANKRKKEIGEENLFDFSLGNPSVAPPQIVEDTIKDLLENSCSVSLHGYTSAPGDYTVRSKIAEYISKKSGKSSSADLIYMTCGAAASLTISLSAVTNKDDEVIVFAPFFPEYKIFIENSGAKMVVCQPNLKDFTIDFEILEKCFSDKTAAVIINSPNNPSGVVYSKEVIEKLSNLLYKMQTKYNKQIYLICDEPYRELVFDDICVPYVSCCYNNTLTCYSFSKSLSLPGERIGYIEVSKNADNSADVFAAICGAGRSLGFVCAPSLMQKTVAECLGKTSDVSVYERNRNLLYKALREIGYDAVLPSGAFYMMFKSLCDDALAFAEKAKDFELVIVPSNDFGVNGYIRIALCVSEETAKNSIPAFKKLYEYYRG